GEGRFRGRLLLAGRGDLPARPGGQRHPGRLPGRRDAEPDLRRCLLRSHRPRRDARGRLRSRAGELRAAARALLGGPRPHPAQPSGAGRRHSVPLGHLLPLPRAGDRGRSVPGGGPVAVQPGRRDRDRPRSGVPRRRGLPPALHREAPGDELRVL
ncbi:MAG: Peptide-methionine (S)-S-oxide reductase MsrA, partial [uncultured Solirubrobacterales bacterium]